MEKLTGEALLEYVINISHRMAEMRRLEPLLLYVIDEVLQFVGAERGFIVLKKEDGELDFKIKRNKEGEDLDVGEDEISLSILDEVINTSKPLLLSDAMSHPQFGQALSVMYLRLRSIMCVPLITRNHTIGAIYVENRTLKNRFRKGDLAPLELYANQAAVAIENATLNDELETANQALLAMNKTKSAFIDVMSHELRTPITTLKMSLQMLEMNKSLYENETSQQVLERATSSVDRLHTIANNMLQVSRIENQVLEMYEEEVMLEGVFADLQFHFDAALAERSLTWTQVGIEDLPIIRADSELLFKLFEHVCGNAIKYTPNGGEITITGKYLNDPPYGFVEIIVADTGIGIAKENLTLIFEKFYQTGKILLHSSGQTKFKGGGPGLGLAIAHGIVVAHEGKIWAESDGYDEETCRGSQFYIQLPLKRNGKTEEG